MSSAGVVAFVAPAAGAGQAASLRGAAPAAGPPAPAEAHAGASAAPWLLGAAAVAAASAAGQGARRPARGVRRALPAAGAAAPAAAPAEAAAPPPPFDPAKEVGVTMPLGYFDPLGFCQVGDYEGFHKLRSAEIKHGRVAMLAAIGTVFQHFVRLPGCEATPAGIKALYNFDGVLGFFLYVVPVVAFLELFYWKDDLSKEPGNFGDPANWVEFPGGFGGYTEEVRNKEINNGRMAMISILGIVVAEIATGKDGIQQFGF